MAVQIEFLTSILYFAGLSLSELQSISKYIFEKAVDKNELILLEDEPGEALYFVVSGVVKVFKTSAEGKEQILGIMRPGDSFNDVSVFDEESNPASAQAMSPATLYGIHKSDMRIVLRDYHQVALNVIRVLAGRLRQLVSLVEDLSFRHVIGRVAKLLLEYAGNGTGPRPRLTQQEMAAMIGTAREVVGRSLKALEEEGAIRMDRHRIVIVNKEALREIVEAST